MGEVHWSFYPLYQFLLLSPHFRSLKWGELEGGLFQAVKEYCGISIASWEELADVLVWAEHVRTCA